MAPDNLVKYKTLPLWNSDTLPKGFQQQHNTKEGTWAKLTITKGKLRFFALSEQGEILETHLFSAHNPAPFIEPQAWHRVEPADDDLECYLEFHCLPEQYFQKKYRLSEPHSEVKAVLEHIKSGNALDLGSGRGRNSLSLNQNGFRVTALDVSEPSIEKLQSILISEGLDGEIDASIYDIETASLTKEYDLIISTVVLQFLSPDSIENVIHNMQNQTKSGGVNLIVAPVSMEPEPYPIGFPFVFEAGELKDYYKDWTTLKYMENMGEFHRTDENGNRIKAKFATIIAQKK